MPDGSTLDRTTEFASTTDSGFDPAVHLVPKSAYTGTNPKITLADLGYPPTSLSEIAATHPFPLFTLEAIRRLRADSIDHDVLANYIYSDNNTPCVVRGHAPDRAKFIYDAWTHPEVRRRINEMAGLELEPVCNYEIGHTNIQLGPRGWAALKPEPDVPTNSGELASAQEVQPTLYEEPNWHCDSYPFVCIVMLSDSSTIKGGQTVIRKADGTNAFVPLPPIGHAVVLHGGHLVHAVSPTETTQERMSMVTSYRPRDPLADDTCVLRTVRHQSDVPTLHQQWSEYRLRVLAERARILADEIHNSQENIEQKMEAFLAAQTAYLTHTVREMTEPVERIRTNTRQTFLDWKAQRDGKAIKDANIVEKSPQNVQVSVA